MYSRLFARTVVGPIIDEIMTLPETLILVLFLCNFQGCHGSKGWQESSLKKTAERLSKSREQQASLQGAEDALFLQTR